MSVEIARRVVELPVAPSRLRRLTLDEYHRMVEIGLFKPSDRLVLLDGLLVKKRTKKPPHCTSCTLSHEALSAVLPAGWHVRQEFPITLPEGLGGYGSEPEPDLAVVAGTRRTYVKRHPGPKDIALIVQIADTSLAEDRKGLVRYAWAAIPAVWIVNLTNKTVEVYTDPTGPVAQCRYKKREIKKAGDVLEFKIQGKKKGDGGRPVGPIAVKSLLP
jgi:Uma2 family endonuclease